MIKCPDCGFPAYFIRDDQGDELWSCPGCHKIMRIAGEDFSQRGLNRLWAELQTSIGDDEREESATLAELRSEEWRNVPAGRPLDMIIAERLGWQCLGWHGLLSGDMRYYLRPSDAVGYYAAQTFATAANAWAGLPRYSTIWEHAEILLDDPVFREWYESVKAKLGDNHFLGLLPSRTHPVELARIMSQVDAALGLCYFFLAFTDGV